jgi:transketolase
MRKNSNIMLVTGDLGYGLFDEIRSELPSQFLNVGAAEQTMIGLAVGLALSGKIPIVYSITPFLLYRPFEFIRNYLDHEKVPVILVGSGRDRDYEHDGFSHWAEEDAQVMNTLPNIQTVWPEEWIDDLLHTAIKLKEPCYINLKR